MNSKIIAYLQANPDTMLGVFFEGGEWMASVTDMEGEPLHIAIGGNDPDAVIEKLASSL